MDLFIYKAQAVGEQEVPDAMIMLNVPIPHITEPANLPESQWRPIAEARFWVEAFNLEKLLHATLPGGTYDALFGQMAARKASVFVVPHRQ